MTRTRESTSGSMAGMASGMAPASVSQMGLRMPRNFRLSAASSAAHLMAALRAAKEGRYALPASVSSPTMASRRGECSCSVMPLRSLQREA